MPTTLAHVGFGNFLPVGRVVRVFSPSPTHVQRLIREAREEGIIIDVTSGRRTRSVAVLDTGRVVLLGLTVKKLGGRGLPTGAVARKRRKTAR